MRNMAKKNRMNVLFIITDQHRADHMGCAGNPIVKTPNLDRLAQDGIRFTNAFCANPMCSPNRACILTGLYPKRHIRIPGVNFDGNLPTYSGVLGKAGYATKAIGKMHLQFFGFPMRKNASSVERFGKWHNEKTHSEMVKNFPLPYGGFSDVDLVVGHGDQCDGHYRDWLEEKAPEYLKEINLHSILDHVYYKSKFPEEVYPTSYITEKSIEFLEKFSRGEYGDKNFLLHVSYPDPHHPVTPPGKWAEMYKPEDMELPESFSHVEYVKNHPFLKKYLDITSIRNMIFRTTNEEEVKNFTALTYGTISMIDNGIGKILATLEKLGLADNTMVIYTSDHGDMAGDHGMLLKGWLPFKGILNVPLIMKVPGITKPGSVSDSLVCSLDFAQTILNICRIRKRKQPPGMEGVDFTPVLKDPETQVRDSVLIEFDGLDSSLGASDLRLKYLITERYKLTIYVNMPDFGDIYDRENDPHELKNLWFSNPELRNELLKKILYETFKAESIYPPRDGMG
jgi:arylsulfatase A-like enzyme